MGVFGDGPANAANRILPRLTLVVMGTKFGTKWTITRHMYEISRFEVLRVEQINNFSILLPWLTFVALATKFVEFVEIG